MSGAEASSGETTKDAVAGNAPPTGPSKGSTEEGQEKIVQDGPAKGDEVKSGGAGGEKERLLEDDPFVEVRKAIKKKWAIPLSGLVNTVLLGMVVGLTSVGVYYGLHHKFYVRNSVDLIAGLVLGSWSGLTLARRYRKARKAKDKIGHILAVDMGAKGIMSVTNGAPYWLSLEEDEKVHWLNSLISQAWPFYEPAICKQVVEDVEPLLKQNKPGYIKSICFKKMTFGSVPFKITHMKVVRVTDSEIALEAGLRWDGTAQVALGVKLFSGVGLCPSVTRILVFAKARITLTPLCDTVPGFGAILVALQEPPLVTFNINAGAGIGKAVEAWLQPFLMNNILGSMFVWPNRLVVPVLPEDVTGSLDKFKLRTRGILRVHVIEAKGLKKQDLLSKGDPYVTLETVPLHPVKTKILNNTLTPHWDEEFFLKVQEVEQFLNIEMIDYDNPALDAFTFSGEELYGRARICIKDLPHGEIVDKWFPLGKGGWGDLGGPGHGEGELHLKLTYMDLASLRKGQFALTPEGRKDNVHHGMLFCRMECAHNLVSVDREKHSDPYGVLWCHDKKKTTGVIKDTLDPEWNEHFEWPNVSSKEMLYIEVHDKGKISDKPMGRAQVQMAELAQKFASDSSLNVLAVGLPLETTAGSKGTKGDVVVHLEWIPLDDLPIPAVATKGTDSVLDVVERGVLMIRLIHGRNLRNVDLGGKSDPYVVFKLGGSEKKSKVVDNSLDPDWNETFRWDSTKKGDIVKITVKDADVFTDKVLGVYEIGVSNATNPAGAVHSFQCKLAEKKKGREPQGYLVLQMYWVPWDKHGEAPEPPEPDWPEIP